LIINDNGVRVQWIGERLQSEEPMSQDPDMPRVRAAGSGGPEDLAAVSRHVRQLSPQILHALRKAGVEVVACQTSVTNYATDLQGKIPRGWKVKPPERQLYWDDVPGAFLPASNEVVIATMALGSQREVPPTGHGHGAFDLVLHETMHGFDYVGHPKPSQSKALKSAWTADYAALDPYEQQIGDAGLEEAFAESAARFFGGDPHLQSRWPALHAYWKASAAVPGAVTPHLQPAHLTPSAAPIGLATMQEDGSLRLELRAAGPAGETGHAMVAYRPTDPGYVQARDRLFGTPLSFVRGILGVAPAARPKAGAHRLIRSAR
jgi:hypothetical protein